jgi:prepilin peptidase CpaA
VDTTTATLVAWLTLAGACDLSRRQLPNGLMLAGLLGARLALLASTHPLAVGPLAAAAGAAGGLLLTLPAYRLGWLGGGDVKFLLVAGAWFGPRLLWVWVLGSITLGLHALATAHATSGPALPSRRLPYGSHMAVAGLAVLAAAWMKGSA